MLMMYRSVSAKSEIPVEEVSEEITGSVIGMANPASVYCEEQGGTVTIVKDEEGNESGICKLADGTEVEEWEYYRVNHKDEAETTS
jgi:putative hemolysin